MPSDTDLVSETTRPLSRAAIRSARARSSLAWSRYWVVRKVGDRTTPDRDQRYPDHLQRSLPAAGATDALARQRAGGRQPFAALQPAGSDRFAQPGLELRPQRLFSAAIELQQQFGPQTGPLNGHRIGPYQ